jgi:hypothetical protein
MNINTLNRQMFFRSFNIFNDNLLNFFGNYYLKNSSHKYELYHNYVFRIDRFLAEITKFVNDENDSDVHHFSKFCLSKNNKNDYLKNGSLNFENKDVLNFCKIATHLFVGEFNWKNGTCSLFLTISDDSHFIHGWAIDNYDDNDTYFSNYHDLGIIEKDLAIKYDEEDELINNLKDLVRGKNNEI